MFFGHSATSLPSARQKNTRQISVCRQNVYRVSFAECNTRQTLCRVFLGFRRVPMALGKVPESGSASSLSECGFVERTDELDLVPQVMRPLILSMLFLPIQHYYKRLYTYSSLCVAIFTCLILRRLYTHIGFDHLVSPPIIYTLCMALHSTHSIFDCSVRALSTNNSPIS